MAGKRKKGLSNIHDAREPLRDRELQVVRGEYLHGCKGFVFHLHAVTHPLVSF